MVWGVPEVWRQFYSSSMNSGKIVAGGRTDGWTGIEGSIRGPRGPKKIPGSGSGSCTRWALQGGTPNHFRTKNTISYWCKDIIILSDLSYCFLCHFKSQHNRTRTTLNPIPNQSLQLHTTPFYVDWSSQYWNWLGIKAEILEGKVWLLFFVRVQ